MQIKTALIILAVLTILSGLFMVYLFQVMKPPARNLVLPKYISPRTTSDIATTAPNKEKSQQDGLTKEEEKEQKQQILEKIETTTSQDKKDKSENMTLEEKEDLKQQMLDKLK